MFNSVIPHTNGANSNTQNAIESESAIINLKKEKID